MSDNKRSRVPTPRCPTRPSNRSYPLNDNLTPCQSLRRSALIGRSRVLAGPLRRDRRSLERRRCGLRSVAWPSLWLVAPRTSHPRRLRRSSLSSGCARSGRTSQGRSSSLPRRAGARPIDYVPLGWPELRELVAQLLSRRGAPTSPDEVLITNGAQEAISLAVGLVASDGRRIAVESPGYPSALDAIVRAGGQRSPSSETPAACV